MAVPVVGKLADQFGRKMFLIGGTLLFVLASVVCTLASTLPQLIVARAQIIGLFTGTYGLASIVGPLLGGAVTDTVGWRDICSINREYCCIGRTRGLLAVSLGTTSAVSVSVDLLVQVLHTTFLATAAIVALAWRLRSWNYRTPGIHSGLRPEHTVCKETCFDHRVDPAVVLGIRLRE